MPADKNKEPAKTAELNYRTLTLRVDESGVPATLDAGNRSVEVVGATENPVLEYCRAAYDYVPTMLLMSGCELPASGQIPLLDTHSRWDTSSVIGSYRGMRVENDKLVGRAVYSSVPEAEGPWIKTTEGHLTDYSVGYKALESTYIPDGQTGLIGGRSFAGPLVVVTRWKAREMSACPIGADEEAKARAATPSLENHTKEIYLMDAKTRAYLERRGLPQTATEEEAVRFLDGLDTQTPAPAGQQRSEDEIRAEATRAENGRINEITAICNQHEVAEEQRAAYLKPGVTVEQVRKEVLDLVVERAQGKTPGFVPQATMGADEKDKFRAAAEHSLILRSGIHDTMVERGRGIAAIAPGATDLMGFSLRELAFECLRKSGQSVTGDIRDVIGRALTTSDLPAILANVANLSLFEGYNSAEETWSTWCGTGSVTDFKANTVARASELDDMDQINEDDEYKYSQMSDAKETFQLVTFGKLFAISRQTIINDQLSALTDIPFRQGESWSRKIGDNVYAVLVANSAMGDGTALFHADHGNVGTSALIGSASIAEGIKLMKLQKDIGGRRRLNIRPQFVIAPVTVEGASEIFFNSATFADGTGSNSTGALAATRTNPYAGARFTRVYEPRLDDSDTKKWYLAGAKGKTVKVFFLNGQQGPYLETKQGWSRDGVEFKVRGDCVAKAIDWKSLLVNAGG